MMYALLFTGALLLVNDRAAGQNVELSYEEKARIDSLAKAYNEREAAKDEDRKNADNLSDLKAERMHTKSKAKEARRVEAEANDAARESKIAYRQEKKAQRARAQADKQSKKAVKARKISDRN